MVTRGAQLAAELAKVGVGRSELAPAKGDRRFKDDGVARQPGVPAAAAELPRRRARPSTALIGDAGLDWRSERQIRFAAENVLDALAPSNAPLTNPAVLKVDARHRRPELRPRGAANFARDMSKPPRIPSMVDTSAFTVGEDIAVTPGAVVLRSPVFELIQYEPQTSKVRELPLLLTPPMINKYYIADLAPGPQHDGVRGQARASRCSRSPGATRPSATPTGTSTPTRPRCSRRSRPSRRSPAPTRPT